MTSGSSEEISMIANTGFGQVVQQFVNCSFRADVYSASRLVHDQQFAISHQPFGPARPSADIPPLSAETGVSSDGVFTRS